MSDALAAEVARCARDDGGSAGGSEFGLKAGAQGRQQSRRHRLLEHLSGRRYIAGGHREAIVAGSGVSVGTAAGAWPEKQHTTIEAHLANK